MPRHLCTMIHENNCATLERESHLPHLFDFNKDLLREWCIGNAIEPFRATQIFQWMYQRGELRFEHMSNIARTLQRRLSESLSRTLPQFSQRLVSLDNTVKWKVSLARGEEIETVWIPEPKRTTLCLSSQVGCALGCKFCATGLLGLRRNLSTAEIIAQVWLACQETGHWLSCESSKIEKKAITNIVFMGMGEPLLNMDALVNAIKILRDPDGWGFAKRKITVSTSGIVPKIYELGKQVDVALAISLHAPDEELRSALMPINRRYPLRDLIPALKWYASQGSANSKGITVEYILLKGINDQRHHAKKLAALLSDIPVKINLIPWNRVPGLNFEPPLEEEVAEFALALQAEGLFSTQRKTRGSDIAAACGQLAGLRLPMREVQSES